MFRSFADDAYAFTYPTENSNGTANGLNQLTAYGPSSLSHDAKGNVTAFGTKSFTYSSENLLLTGPGSTTLAYDPLMRLRRVDVSGAIIKAIPGTPKQFRGHPKQFRGHNTDFQQCPTIGTPPRHLPARR